MPEPIRLKACAVTPQQMAIYDEFSTKICGFKPTTAEDMLADFAPPTTTTATGSRPPAAPSMMMTQAKHVADKELDAMTVQMSTLIREIDTLLSTGTNIIQLKPAGAVSAIRDAMSAFVLNARDTVSAMNLLQRLVEQLLHAYKNPVGSTHPDQEWQTRLGELFVQLCQLLNQQFGFVWLSNLVTRTLIDCLLEYRYNLDAIALLIRCSLINMPTYDLHLSTLMENGSNFEATVFAQRLVHLYSTKMAFLQEKLPITLEIVHRLSQYQQSRSQHADL
jgi:hypothetical protein